MAPNTDTRNTAISPIVVHLSIYNAKGLQLARDEMWALGLKWPKQHLDLGEFVIEDVETEAHLLPKRLCDRLWTAFHLERSELFDNGGRWVANT